MCPPIDFSRSVHYDLENTKLVEWIFQIIAEGRFRAVICEPVCRTFSPAQRPASRSYANPLGFNRKARKTYVGNFIASRCLAILWMAWRHLVISLLEQPQFSKMAWLPFWRYLLTLMCLREHPQEALQVPGMGPSHAEDVNSLPGWPPARSH